MLGRRWPCLRSLDELQEAPIRLFPRRRLDRPIRLDVERLSHHFPAIGKRSEQTQPDGLNEHIAQSGGLTSHADASKIYVVRANGNVVANSGGFFRINSDAVKIHPGDTIDVPLDTEKLPPLPMWQAITQILYNIAVSVAAVHSLSL